MAPPGWRPPAAGTKVSVAFAQPRAALYIWALCLLGPIHAIVAASKTETPLTFRGQIAPSRSFPGSQHSSIGRSSSTAGEYKVPESSATRALTQTSGSRPAAPLQSSTMKKPYVHIPPYSCTEQASYSANYVPGKPQKYIMFARVWEQLTKAKAHLAELVAMAQAANRTLVLPHCGNSQLGSVADYRFPLCTYLSVEGISAFAPWVTEEYFYSQVMPRTEAPDLTVSAFVMASPWMPCDYNQVFKIIGTDGGTPGRQPFPAEWQHALGHQHFRRGVPKMLASVCTSDCGQGPGVEPGRSADDILLNHPGIQASDVVLVLKGHWRHCVKPQLLATVAEVESKVTYADHLIKLVDDMVATRLSSRPYIAIHWRMEKAVRGNVNGSALLACAQGLVQTVRAAQAGLATKGCRDGDGDCPLPPVFFATDIRLNGRTLSNSWAGVNSLFALEAVKHIHKELSPFNLTDYMPKLTSADPGVQGIVDKLVCSKAAVMLVPPGSCMAAKSDRKAHKYLSNFTRETCQLRLASGQENCTTWSCISIHTPS